MNVINVLFYLAVVKNQRWFDSIISSIDNFNDSSDVAYTLSLEDTNLQRIVDKRCKKKRILYTHLKGFHKYW